LIWLADDLGAGVLAVAALIGGPHIVQDDGRLVAAWIRNVKRSEVKSGPLPIAVDQSFHFLSLFVVALVAGT